MKRTLLCIIILLLASGLTKAQTLHEVRGVIQDTTGASLPGTSIRLVSGTDTLATAANVDGAFVFPKVKAAEFSLTIDLIGFTPINRHYIHDKNVANINIGILKMKVAATQLKGVTIVGTNPIRIKEDTVEFNAGAYKVRENAPTEDMIRKLPGVDVDKDGNITDRGKSVTKIRINGKDFMGGDVKSVTKNLPADVIENIQMIDDYGDQANLTGVKTGEPDRIMNITIRKDRNVGYSLQATAGDGRDALPATNSASVDPSPTNPAAINNNENHNRYLGTVNYFSFKGNRQISVLGNINNTNINTFTYGGGGRGGGGGFGGGGGGRGNALRGASTTTNQNGITDAHAIGLNYRDQWGKKLSVYGSYSFSDNLGSTISNSYQQGINAGETNSVLQNSTQSTRNINHRLTWNMEYKPDTINYFKFTPTYSYGSVSTNADGNFSSFREEIANVAYRQFSTDISKSPNIGATLLYNHKFPGRRNLSINLTANSAKTDESDNPTTLYSPGSPMASPKYQLINTNSRTNSFGTNVSFLQPIGKVSYLEFNYNLNHSYTTSDKRTDTLNAANQDVFYQRFSNNYNYTFTTNKVGLSYRVVESKYNFTVGLGLQPAVLDGYSPTTNQTTHVSTLNFAPVAHFNYNFSRTQAINLNYNGSSNQPNFNYLQPVIDFSNALYPVQGNPNLIPEFNNNVNLRYNRFSFATGDILFTNLSFNQTSNKIVANSIQYPKIDPLNPTLAGTYLTKYQNADGYYSSSIFGAYSKPWAKRKYTLTFNANANYTNNIGYSSRVTYDAVSNTETLNTERNVAKSLVVTPGVRFRTDITDIIDAELNSSYSINTINNSIISSTFQNTVARTLSLGLNGKNYLWKNYTVSYDYTKLVYSGYNGVSQKNPNILNAYVERRFLKANAATIRIAAYDLFNQNTGYTFTPNNGAAGYTVSNVNRLGRYYLLSFSLRLQKFAGKAPSNPDDFRGGGERRGGGGFGGGRPQ
ncbi:MAG: TonB-dependent receptor [Mucilaginibacter sp.]|uniref:TonB-dependent receptor n=1 Tax=Mucilaginibacter sp. TaxID=1882438 RepID=UPI0034E3ED72